MSSQVLSGKIPYHYIQRDGQVVINLYNGITPKRPVVTRITDELWEFINSCWTEPAHRPTIGDVSTFVRRYRARCEEEWNAAKSGDDSSRSSKLKESNLDDVCHVHYLQC